MLCYSNDGHSMRAVSDDYVAQNGEVLFANYATETELQSAFQEYITAIKTQKIENLNTEYEEKYAAKLKQLTTAQALNKSTVVTAVQQQYAALMAEHKTKKEAINNG